MEASNKPSDCIFASNYILAASKLLKFYHPDISDMLLQLSINLLNEVPSEERDDFETAIKDIKEAE